VTQLEAIIARYTELRVMGVSAQEAIHTLKTGIQTLNNADRQTLSQSLKSFEAEMANQPPADSEHTPAFIHRDRHATLPVRETTWINCPHCGRSNQAHEILCYACGNFLRPGGGTNATRTLSETNDLEHSDDYFGEHSTLILQPRHVQGRFEIEAPAPGTELIVGRTTPNSSLVPDIDLSPIQAEDYGVSRLHLSLSYNPEHHTLTIVDLGSANGTYINGQRLHPHELRVLRQGDELRMAKMIMTVLFQHAINP
jgi:hypothetical protein